MSISEAGHAIIHNTPNKRLTIDRSECDTYRPQASLPLVASVRKSANSLRRQKQPSMGTDSYLAKF